MEMQEELKVGDFVKFYTASGVFMRHVEDIWVASNSTTHVSLVVYTLKDPHGDVEYATWQCMEKI